MFLTERYEQLAAEVARLAHSQVRIVLVTKYRRRDDIYSALGYFNGLAGSLANDSAAADTANPAASLLPNLGENYVQAAARRRGELEDYYASRASAYQPQIELIGPLQSNKTANAVQLCSVLHSISSPKLLRQLEKSCSRYEHRIAPLSIFFQYNASGEQQKAGCRDYRELRNLTDELLSGSRLCLRGLMCMSAAGSEERERRRAFADCRKLAQRLWHDYPPAETGGRLAGDFELSMGMSQDYREALAEGAHVLRIGSLLFSS